MPSFNHFNLLPGARLNIIAHSTHAQVITRGTRSLGYGFVSFSNETEAQTAIQLLNKREIGGREISVESAKPQAVANAEKPKSRRTRSKSKANKESTRAPRRARADEGEEGAAEEDAAKAATNGDETKQANGDKPSKSAKRRQKKKAAAAAAAANGETTTATTEAKAESSEAKPRAPRAKRQPKGSPKGEPSKTLVFVANLSFATTDDSLKAAFSDYKIKSAHVVKRRSGGRSKGFGFVDFEDESEQQRAISSAQGKQIDGRDVTLQVAVEKADVEAAEAAEATPAAA